MNIQIACSKIAFNIFLWTAIGVLPIIATQVCDIPPAFEQKTTTLTCKFDMDVNTLKKDIAVLHYDNNDPHNPETVLYSAIFQGEIKYFTRPGFTIISNVTDTLVLRVDRVTRNRIGRYECHTLPSVVGDVEPCNFLLKDVVNDVRDTSKHMDTTVKQHSTDALKGHGENFPFLITYIIGAIMTTLALIGIITVLVILYKRKPQRGKESREYTPANTGS